MKSYRGILVVSAFAAVAGCTSSSPYVYDPYYGYYPVAYDDAYYDYAAVAGYYYYPGYYVYEQPVDGGEAGAAVDAAASGDAGGSAGAEAGADASVSADAGTAAATQVPPFVRLILARWNVSIDPACASATPSADNDGDGIPANSTVTFQCNATTSGGGTATVAGSVTIMDLDDSAADAGYSVTFNGFTVHVVASGGAVTERVFNGTETVAKADGGVGLMRDLVINNTDTFQDNVQRRSTLQIMGNGTFMPDPVDGSARVTSGTLTLSGQGTFTSADFDGATVAITRQTDPTLHWDNDCSRQANNQGFDSGAVVYRTSLGRQTRIVHTSCTGVTATNSVVDAQ